MTVSLAALGNRTSIVGWSAALSSGQANLVHETFVALVRLSLEAQKSIAHVLQAFWTDALVQEWCGKHFEDQRSTASLVADDIIESVFLKE